jgi:hypothetical protein
MLSPARETQNSESTTIEEQGMSQLKLKSDILTRAEWLARQRGISVEQLVNGLIEQACPPAKSDADLILGLFRDEPDLMDQVAEVAMRSREQQPLRLSNG